jgi:hypothetical protein
MQRQAADWAGNIVALLTVIAVNALANILPIAGKMTGEVSDKYASLFTPAGFTFGIWSLIYAALLGFVIYQALPAQRDSRQLADLGSYFKIGCGANVLWILAWHHEWLVPSLLLMLILLATLVFIYRDLQIVDAGASAGQRWFLQFPFGLYLGWITVATIANTGAVQSALGWNDLGISEVAWTQLKLAIAAAIAAYVIFRRNDIVFALVIAWAAFGITTGQAGSPAVAGAAVTISMACLLMAGCEILRRLRSD